MRPPLYLGDELTAAGFRLVGLDTRIPPGGGELAALRQACSETDLVLLSRQTADRIPEQVLAHIMARPSLLVVLVEDARGAFPLPDPGQAFERQLGLGE